MIHATMDAQTYRQLQQEWVTGHQGGPIWWLPAIGLVFLSGYAFWLSLDLHKQPASWNWRTFLSEFVIIVMPVLAGNTEYFVEACVLAACLLLMAVWRRMIRDPTPNRALLQLHRKLFIEDAKKRRFVTVYRAFMMLATCSAILAVDFPLFPRSYAKVETFGISLMDVGVGCFVFSQGIMSGHRLSGLCPGWQDFKKSLRASLPLWILGSVRLFLVKATDYQEHVSEYGVHWNFFCTLAVLPTGVCLGLMLFGRITPDFGIIAFMIAGLYEWLLRYAGLQQWILEAPRDNLISANKEGLTSLFGFLAIFFAGAKLGKYFATDRPVTSWRRSVPLVLIGTTASLWTAYALLTTVFEQQVSRRMANAMFVLVTCAYNLFLITSCFLADLYLSTTPETPLLLESVSRNQLAVFLLANVLTGLVNKAMYTLFQSNTIAWTILIGYLMVVSLAAVLLRPYRIK